MKKVKVKMIPITAKIAPETAKALDEWRRNQQDIPTRSTAVRRILERVLRNREPRKPKSGESET
jgi:hypothetical protein